LSRPRPRNPAARSATRADLTGFPPLLLQVGSDEILLDDSTRLAERAGTPAST
jgi:acetyl esterase/lipase